MPDGLIMTPQSDENIARLGEIAALRQITDTLNRMGQFMQGMADEQKTVAAKLGEMHTDITVMKIQGKEIQDLKDGAAALAIRVTAIELKQAGEDGAKKSLVAVREWSPFILSVVVAVFALIKSGLIHL